MKSETIRNRLESHFYIITEDKMGNREHKGFDHIQDAYNHGLKLIKNKDFNIIELSIEIENISDNSPSNIVKNETIYLKWEIN